MCSSQGVPRKGDKITSGYISPAFSEDQDWAESLPKPRVLGGPHKSDTIKTGYITLVCSEGPRLGGIATYAVCSGGFLEHGTQSLVATSPLSSQGPTTGRHCYVTPALFRIPKQGDQIKRGYITFGFSRSQPWVELLHNPFVLVVRTKEKKI